MNNNIINTLADDAHRAGYLLEHVRMAADRLDRGVSPVVIVESLRHVIENCERATGRYTPSVSRPMRGGT